MDDTTLESLFGGVENHAFYQLSWRERQTSNLYLLRRIVNQGESLGPRFQKVVVDRPSILVFVDGQPLSGFGHPCRYLLYDARTGSLYRKFAAQFPPVALPDSTLTAFHQPVPTVPQPSPFSVRPRLWCPVEVPDGERYAILFSGMAWLRNLNNLEFCYRMLLDRYGFRPENIFVHLYDGTLNTMNGPGGAWPGDGTPYRLHLTAQGTRTALQATLGLLKTKLRPNDLLFLHTENESGNDGQSFLAAYPNWNAYHAAELAADLGGLLAYRSLIALMASCFSGGFAGPLLASSTATNASVSCSTSAGASTASTLDGNFAKFGMDWISAQMGHDPYGAALAWNPDTDGDGVIQAEEAFGYAFAIRYWQIDQSSFSESSEAGGDITLGQRYIFWPWWCWLVLPILEPYYERLPNPEFYARLNRLTPQLQEIVVPVIDRTTAELRKQVTPKVESVIASVFGAPPS